MKIIHIESGLGNQMLSFCEYLAMKEANPDDEIFIETMVYEIPECNQVICQWFGYELDKIFGINVPNIKSLFDEKEWKTILSEVRSSRFWEKNWNYPVYITEVLNRHGLNLTNIRGDFEKSSMDMTCGNAKQSFLKRIKESIKRSTAIIRLRYIIGSFKKQPENPDNSNFFFPITEDNLFTGQWLFFKLKNYGIERIEREIRKAFVFPKIVDSKNKEAIDYIKSHESVAIHARRGDMMGTNYEVYVNGYFKRAVSYIRKHTKNPTFFIFCNPGSVQWAKENAIILGLDFAKDEIHFVDWNKAEDSYRDLQLMASCKHQVITHSSFGWWAAWLNEYPNTITCSPSDRFNTTNHF